MSTRKEKAANQRLYLIDCLSKNKDEWNFDIEGSTGTIYKVYLNTKIQKCNCLDFCTRGILCKHILFVILRVAGDKKTFNKISIDNKTSIYEINPKFSSFIKRRIKTRTDYTDKTDDNIVLKDDPCAICYEDIAENINKKLLKQCKHCKFVYHSGCLTVWLRRKNTCPMCRSEWEIKESEHDPLSKFKNENIKTKIK